MPSIDLLMHLPLRRADQPIAPQRAPHAIPVVCATRFHMLRIRAGAESGWTAAVRPDDRNQRQVVGRDEGSLADVRAQAIRTGIHVPLYGFSE